MSGLSPSAPFSVRNVLIALDELDRAGPTNTLPGFTVALPDSDSYGETICGMLERLSGESTPAGVREKLLSALRYLLSKDGLPHEFAVMAVDGLRNANPEAAGQLRNRIQAGFETMAAHLERMEPARATHAVISRRVGPLPAGSDFSVLGWERIGTSSYWRDGDVIGMAKPGVCPIVLSEYRVGTDSVVTAIRVTNRDAYFKVKPKDARDHGLREMHLSGSTSSVNWMYNNERIADLKAHFDGLSGADSLRASGFVEVAPGAFELVVNDDHTRYDLLALVEGNRIIGIHKGDLAKAHPLLRNGDFRILDVKTARFGDELVCAIENAAVGVRFTKSGSFFTDVSLLRPLDTYAPHELGIGAPYLPHREETGFVVGGRNTSDAIRACRSFNGIPVEDLETKMRPGVVDSDRSVDGFLQPHEDLREEMAVQNDFVLGQGSSHQAVVRHLELFQATYRLGAKDIVYHGVAYHLRGHPAFGGPQESPFSDGSGGGGGFYLSVAGAPEKEVLVTPTAIDMIERWGFYEGRACEWHLNPQLLFAMLASAFAHKAAK